MDRGDCFFCDEDSKQRFARWLRFFSIFVFDTEEGQKFECGTTDGLNARERRSLGFLVFPDSTRGPVSQTSVIYFRLHTSSGFVDGASCFLQVPTEKSHRGCLQRSVVLVCGAATPRQAAEWARVGAEQLAAGANEQAALLAICKQLPDSPVPLRYGGARSHLATALGLEPAAPGEAWGPERQPLCGSLPMKSLWMLWELALCGEALLIAAASPGHASSVVLALAALISPLAYAGDLRPHFTVYDDDFQSYRDRCRAGALRGVLFGAANPLMAQSFPGLTTILLDDKNRNADSLRKERGCCLPYDRALLKTMEFPKNVSMSTVQADARDQALQRYFLDLTLAFLQPLVHFAERLESADSPFDCTRFLAGLSPSTTTGPFASLPRSKCLDLYSRFINGPNFQSSLVMVRERLSQRQQRQDVQ